MKNVADLAMLIEREGSSLKYVFSKADLAHLFSTPLGPTLDKRIAGLIKRGVLERAVRGVFYAEKAALEDLALKIFPNGYLSLDSALSAHQMIGTKPSHAVSILTTRAKGKTFKTSLGTIEMSVHREREGTATQFLDSRRVATPEQALIDSCYYYLRGKRYPFNLHSEVDLRKVYRKKIKWLLSRYKNPKFITFVNGLLDEYGR